MTKPKILVVDDIKEVYTRIKTSLNEGYEVDYADNVADAKYKIREEKYHLIITDFEIGEEHLKGGLEIISAANKENTPVIGISIANHVEEAINAGAKRFFFKKDLYGILELDNNLNSMLF